MFTKYKITTKSQASQFTLDISYSIGEEELVYLRVRKGMVTVSSSSDSGVTCVKVT